ncbi:MAG: hypothetical protein IJQ82_02620 [Selenomonadaceae bacterium]|nr:hypothetical protein [Selenomonadaceae bacterium]
MMNLLTADEETLVEMYRSMSIDDKRFALMLLAQEKKPNNGFIHVVNYVGNNNTIAINGSIYIHKREESDNG